MCVFQLKKKTKPIYIQFPNTVCVCVHHGGLQIDHKSTQRQVDIKIKKQEERWWDRLTLQEKKPLFLGPDFDRWLDESDAEMELQAKVGTRKSNN